MNIGAGEGYGDADRLPWLETVDEDYREGPAIGRIALIAALAIAVLAIGGFGYYWFQQRQALSGNGGLIAAPKGDYKVKPDEPGGMKVEGEGDTVFATSQGNAGNSSINVEALPEAPVEGNRVPATARPGPGTKTATLDVPPPTRAEPRARPRIPAAAPANPGSGSVIQLGAFPSEGGANIAWARLSKRFSYLAPLGKSVERTERDGETFWRLRVNAGSNGQARELCGKLKVAGEACYIAN